MFDSISVFSQKKKKKDFLTIFINTNKKNDYFNFYKYYYEILKKGLIVF